MFQLRAKGVLLKDMLSTFDITPEQLHELINDKTFKKLDYEMKKDELLSGKASNIHLIRRLLSHFEAELKERNASRFNEETLFYGYCYLEDALRREEWDFISINLAKP